MQINLMYGTLDDILVVPNSLREFNYADRNIQSYYFDM